MTDWGSVRDFYLSLDEKELDTVEFKGEFKPKQAILAMNLTNDWWNLSRREEMEQRKGVRTEIVEETSLASTTTTLPSPPPPPWVKGPGWGQSNDYNF